MSCQNSPTKNSDSQPNKVRVMAMRYQKYLQKKKESQNELQKYGCVIKVMRNVYSSIGKIWDYSIPQMLKGPSTPYEVLAENIGGVEKRILTDISLSKLTISESLQNGSITVILTIPKEGVYDMVGKVEKNQQINLLLKNKAQIIPIFTYPKFSTHTPISAKIRHFLLSKMPEQEFAKQQYLLVCWKGLFDQILVLDFFSLEDPNLYKKVIQKIDQRQQYESEIKEIACENDELGEYTSRTGMEKSTSLTKQSSDRSH